MGYRPSSEVWIAWAVIQNLKHIYIYIYIYLNTHYIHCIFIVEFLKEAPSLMYWNSLLFGLILQSTSESTMYSSDAKKEDEKGDQ